MSPVPRTAPNNKELYSPSVNSAEVENPVLTVCMHQNTINLLLLDIYPFSFFHH